MANELQGKVAIITGAAKGIGRATVELFAKEGAKVVIADVDEAEGSALAARLGDAALFRSADVSSKADVEALVATAAERFGGLDIMFNNAGISDPGGDRPFVDFDFANFDAVVRVNLLGAMLGTQIAARHMMRHGGGSIINTSSIGGVTAGHGFPVYRSAKAGVIQFIKAAAIELGEHGIRVNGISPGNIQTTMGSHQNAAPGQSQAEADELVRRIRAVRLSRQPLKLQGVPDDIAQTALFLASDRARLITGQVLAVDAGATAGDARSVIAEIMEVRREMLGE